MKCKICGKEENPSRWINHGEMEKHQMCFGCNFWRKMYEEDKKLPPHTACMIDGTHYIARRVPPVALLGYHTLILVFIAFGDVF